jgi:D-alanyl-D-alanine carboxypeptidase/D-alanyl-D-alanine-endopeptidase (penicillin-binding protein 4)
VGSLTSLAAEGNGEALVRLVELARASAGDAAAQRTVSGSLADVARTAPDELLVSLRGAAAADREAALGLLAQGVAQQQDADHPLWPAVRKVMASTDAAVAAFGRELDATLSQRMAAEKAPRVVQAAGSTVPAAQTQPAVAPAPTDRPGG